MIYLKNCKKIYPNNNIGIQNVNLLLPSTGLVGIFGDSGSGKSTLINCLGGLDSFTSGEIYIDDIIVKDLKKYSTYVFQESKLLEELSVYDNIIFSINHISEFELDAILLQLGIQDIKYAKVNSISGGQRQRVAIARALVKEVPILICDEPTANLDIKTSNEIFSLLKKLSEEKLIIIVSHDIELLKKYTNNLIEVFESKIKETFSCINIEKSDFKSVNNTLLSIKAAFKLCFNNLRHNKVKAIMTSMFLFISLTAIALLMTILLIDIDKVSYNTFKKNNVDYIQFNKCLDNKIGGYELAIPENELGHMNAEIICYDNINFGIKHENSYHFINSMWVTQVDVFQQIELKKSEIILSDNIAKELVSTNESILNTLIYTPAGELLVKGVLDNKYNDVIIMNQETFKMHNSNLYELGRVTVGIEEGIKYSYTIFNPYIHKTIEADIQYGIFPTKDNEVCLPIQLAEKLFPNKDLTTLLNKSVSLNFLTSGIFDTEQTSGLYTTENFTISGFTNNFFLFSNNQLSYYTSLYSSSRISAGKSGIIFFNYTLDTFKRATSHTLFHSGNLSDDIYFVYLMFHDFTLIFLSLAIIFALITILTIMNSASTSILKSKKDLGVLISFQIKKSSLLKIFLYENLIGGVIAIIGSSLTYGILISIINTGINKQYSMNISFLRFNILIILLLIVFSAIFILVAISLPLRKLKRKTPIDILYER